MNDDMNLDPVDDEIGRRLRGMAPSQPDTSTILAGLGPRMALARRRRRAAVAGSSALATVLLVGSAAALSDTRATRIDTRPGSQNGGSSSSDGSGSTDGSDSDTTADSKGTSTSDDNTGSGRDHDDPGSGTTDTTDDDHSGTGSGGNSGSGGNGSGGGGSTSSSQPTNTTDDPEPSTRPCTSPGGSITVRLSGGALTLLTKQPAAGFEETREQIDSGRIRIEFTDSDDDEVAYKVEARVLAGAIACGWELEPVDDTSATTDDAGGSGGSGSGSGGDSSGSGSGS